MTARPAIEPSLGGLRVLVAGIARSGRAAADLLLSAGNEVVVVDADTSSGAQAAADALLQVGARVRLGDGLLPLLADVDLVVSSPGWPPSAPLLLAAQASGVPVWAEVELAWRLRPPGAAPWLVVTGTNGKTTTTRMLAAMLAADGLRTEAAGNIGLPLSSVVARADLDVLAVELGSPQLHSVHSVAPHSAVVLNLAPDHVDWHGSLAAYHEAKARAYRGVRASRVANLQDPLALAMAQAAEAPGSRLVGFTLAPPARGALGVLDGVLVDRAFGSGGSSTGAGEGVPLAAVEAVTPAAPHNVANALAAAALARSFGVRADAVAGGLADFEPEPHRIALVVEAAGVRYVDDSKATNTHAAATSLAAYPSVVWIAGGLAKGADFDELVARHAGRFRAVVLLGADRGLIAEALRRHAPQIPVFDVGDGETDAPAVMGRVVDAAVRFAEAGDTVLLAPACASWDQFRDYGERGDLFAERVRAAVLGEV